MLAGDADHLEQFLVGELIGRTPDDTRNGYDVIYGVCAVLRRFLLSV